MQLRLKIDFSDSKCNLFSLLNDKLIFFPEENFLTMSYIIDAVVVVLPSSIISTLSIWWINIKSKSVAVILSLAFPVSIKIFDKIGNVLLFLLLPDNNLKIFVSLAD